MENSKSHLLEYAQYVQDEARRELKKSDNQKVTSQEIANLIDQDATSIRGNTSEPNIHFFNMPTIEIGKEDWAEDTIGTKSIASFLNDNINTLRDLQKHREKLAIIAKIFNLKNELEHYKNPSRRLEGLDPNQLFFKKYVEDRRPTFQWEQCMMWLIDSLHSSTVTKMTMCLDDLSLVFKMMPTLLHFINHRRKKIHLIFAPPHAYWLLGSKEFISLWKLGITITLFDFKESLNDSFEKGFIFNWLPEDGEPDVNKLDIYGLEMIVVSTNSFDRYPVAKFLPRSHSSVTFRTIQSLRKKLQSPYQLALEPLTPSINRLEANAYERWFENRMLENNDSQYKQCKAELKNLEVNDIYYRHRRFTRYRLFQAYKILTALNHTERNDSTLFHPYNIFDNGPELCPSNPPVVEWNPYTNRWEAAEGHHRLLASTLLGGNGPMQVLTVTNLETSAFNKKSGVPDVGGGDWRQALNYIVDYHRQEQHLYELRHIERITHNIDLFAYKKLAEILSDDAHQFVTKEEVFHFSLKRIIWDEEQSTFLVVPLIVKSSA